MNIIIVVVVVIFVCSVCVPFRQRSKLAHHDWNLAPPRQVAQPAPGAGSRGVGAGVPPLCGVRAVRPLLLAPAGPLWAREEELPGAAVRRVRRHLQRQALRHPGLQRLLRLL